MTAVILWYVIVGAVALALTAVYVSQRKPESPARKAQEPQRWHKEFDEPV